MVGAGVAGGLGGIASVVAVVKVVKNWRTPRGPRVGPSAAIYNVDGFPATVTQSESDDRLVNMMYRSLFKQPLVQPDATR